MSWQKGATISCHNNEPGQSMVEGWKCSSAHGGVRTQYSTTGVLEIQQTCGEEKMVCGVMFWWHPLTD
jgi:hypothetical protein